MDGEILYGTEMSSGVYRLSLTFKKQLESFEEGERGVKDRQAGRQQSFSVGESLGKKVEAIILNSG